MITFRALRHRRPPAHAAGVAAGGFTLIELMVTIAVAAIMLSIAAPGMTRLIGSNRIQTEASGFVADMQYARTEAIRRGYNVTVCPSSNGTSCLTANTWHSGWMVFSDRGTTGVFDAASSDTMLRLRKAFTNSDTAVAYVGSSAAAPTNNYITFNREGFASGPGTGTAIMKFNLSSNDVKSKRCVAIDLAGRLTTLVDGGSSMGAGC